MPIANAYLSFQGVGFSTGSRRGFDVLCGDNPPTIKAGYANWSKLKRPLQRALTYFQDYDPVQMVVEVRFGKWNVNTGEWQIDDSHGQQIESDIGRLEWMAGANFTSGPSPAVYVWSHGAQGSDTDLIPPQYANRPWIVTGLEWNKAIRNQNGYRVWQDATITLEGYLNLNAAPEADKNVQGSYFTSRAGRDTALLIAAAPTVRSPLVEHRLLAQRILADAKNNPCKGTRLHLSGRSLSWQIRHGVPVFVPTHQTL